MSPSPRLWRIGLTGGIGSGKSTVAGMLAECGAAVIDADAISRSLTAAGGRAIAQQARRTQRLACADLVVCNQGLSLQALRTQVQALARLWGL